MDEGIQERWAVNGGWGEIVRPSGCVCRDPWQVCEACKDVPRDGGRLAGVPMTISAFRLTMTVQQNLIPEQVQEFKENLWDAWDGGTVDGEAAAAALARMAGEPDEDVVSRTEGGYITQKM